MLRVFCWFLVLWPLAAMGQSSIPNDPFLSVPPPTSRPRPVEPAPRPAQPRPEAAPPANVPSRYPVPIGQSFRDCADCPEMMVIPAGSFEMGSRAGVTRSFRGIDPQTQVTLRAPLAVTRWPITLGQFRAFADETGHQTPGGCWRWDPQADRNVLAPELSWRSPGFPQEDDHPVVCVSWDDTQAYARWVSQRSGQRYRLPTEAEWEYAARAGTRTRWWWGEREADQCRYANGLDQRMVQVASIWSRYEVAPCDDGFAFTSPVTRFAANGFGLHDMGGNAWQWVEDCWQGSHAGAPNDASVAVTTENCASRVLRGGGWADSLQTLSAAHRFSYEPRIRHTALGFRLARTPGG